MEPDVNPAQNISHAYIYIYIHYWVPAPKIIGSWELIWIKKKIEILRIFTDHTTCTLFRKQTEQAGTFPGTPQEEP